MVRLALLCVEVVLAGCVDLGGPAPDAGPLPDAEAGPVDGDGGLVYDVAIAGMAFRPAKIQILVGATVRWTNYDAVPHTATQGRPGVAGTPYFASPLLSAGSAGDSYEFRFVDRGEWLYFCTTHPNVMKDAVVQVQ